MSGTVQENNSTRTIITVSLNSKEQILTYLIHFDLVIPDLKNAFIFFPIRQECYGESNLVSPLAPRRSNLNISICATEKLFILNLSLIIFPTVSLTTSSYYFQNCMKTCEFFIITFQLNVNSG